MEMNNQEAPVEKMSAVARLGNIFMEPSRTLADVANRPTWVVPLIVSLLVGFIPYVIQPNRVDREARVRAAVERMAKFTSQDPKKLEETMLAQPETFYAKYQTILIGIPAGVAGILAVAGILLLAFLLMGSQITFKRSLAAWCWSTLPPSILGSLLAIVFLYAKDPADLNPLDPRANVISHLGFLVGEKSQPVLHSLLSSVDVFSFWSIYLLGVGYAAASMGNMTSKKATAVMIVLWVLYVMIKTGISGIFS